MQTALDLITFHVTRNEADKILMGLITRSYRFIELALENDNVDESEIERSISIDYRALHDKLMNQMQGEYPPVSRTRTK